MKTANHYVTRQELARTLQQFATKQDLIKALENYPTKQDLAKALENCATKQDLKDLEARIDIKFEVFSRRIIDDLSQVIRDVVEQTDRRMTAIEAKLDKTAVILSG